MKRQQTGFAYIFILVIFAIVIALFALARVRHWKLVEVESSNSSSTSTSCYAPENELSDESQPPASDSYNLSKTESNVSVRINFADDGLNQITDEGACVNYSSDNGKKTRTIVFSLNKTAEGSESGLAKQITLQVGRPRQFVEAFSPKGEYLVKIIIKVNGKSSSEKVLGTVSL